MDASSSKAIAWHVETLPRKTKRALDFLSAQTWLASSSWYLAGGTALALRAGHRRSLDLDFFTAQTDFVADELLAQFAHTADWQTIIDRKNTVYGELYDTKVSFIAYPFFAPQQEPARYGNIRVLAPTDIAVMKVIAIAQRGRKRDFIDLYWCAHNVEPLGCIIRRLKKQYPSVAHDYHHILKSLVYFVDAQSDPMPDMNFKVSWREVTHFFKKEIPRLAVEMVGLR